MCRIEYKYVPYFKIKDGQISIVILSLYYFFLNHRRWQHALITLASVLFFLTVAAQDILVYYLENIYKGNERIVVKKKERVNICFT